MERWQTAGFGLYVHWPFCQSKCPYCDFNSHVAGQIDQEIWLQAYLRELDRAAEETKGRVLSSIFFGGGTPSLMPPATVAAIIDKAVSLWTPANDIEITLEANPTSVEASKFAGFKAAGVNRVSIGVQALNDQDLRLLGRMHSAEEAIAAVKVAQKTFERSSFDLIYARQNQSLEDWRAELTKALGLAADHLSMYQLTIEPGTVFGSRAQLGKLKGLPSEDLGADMYELTQELCDAAGMPAYEVSNHALPGSYSRHNMIYWQCGDYVGIGPGAHGRLTDSSARRSATYSVAAPNAWLEAVNTKGSGITERDTITRPEQADELLLMGMRTDFGVDIREVADLRSGVVDQVKIKDLQDMGLVTLADYQLTATKQGRIVLNQILRHLSD